MTLLLSLCLAQSPPATTSSAVLPRPRPTEPARRPLDEYPAFVRPFLKYGLGAAVVLWFVGGIGWLCRQRWRQATTAAAKAQARRWIAGMLLGVALSLALVAVGIVVWLKGQWLEPLFLAGPAAVLLPPLCARWLGGAPRQQVR